MRSTNVALLTEKDTAAILRQSETDGTLMWQEAALKAVWELTKGHPYFTQLIGSVIWEQAYEEDVADQVMVTSDMITKAVPTAFNQGRNAFVWIWDGLPPAERVVMAAMAEAQETVIRPEGLVQILNESGVRLIVRQLELAPETLIEWGVLEAVDGGHRFCCAHVASMGAALPPLTPY